MSKKLTIDFILNKANNNNPKNIRVLNLRGNKISDISILSELTALENISLNANQIKDISVFKKLKNIREIYLKDNQINDLTQFENLKNCKKLEKLAIKDNPITTIPNYIQKIVEILPQLKKLDDLDLKQFKFNNNNSNNNNNFNSPLLKKDSNQNQNQNNIINNNYNIQSPNVSKNNISVRSGSESISSDRKGEAKNDSAAPDPQTSLYPPNISDNLNIDEFNSSNNNNINNGMNMFSSYNAFNLKLNNNRPKDKTELLNRSFKKKITEGSFRKVVKNKNNLNNANNNITQEEKKKKLLERSINDNKLKAEKLSQTLSSGFYKNPLKGPVDSGNRGDLGGYRKKIIGNFKQEQEHKENNINKQNVINTVFKKYQYFDNDNDNEEEKKKNNESPKKNIFHKFNTNNKAMTSYKKNENLEQKINIINEKSNSENKIIENGKKEEKINKSVVESIKLLMSTLSIEGLKQIESDVQKLIEAKHKN